MAPPTGFSTLPRIVALAFASLLVLAGPLSGQAPDLVPDLDDPRAFDAARRWMEKTLREVKSGRKVLVRTPDGPLPWVVVDRSALSGDDALASVTGTSRRDALRWSTGVLGDQAELRTSLARTRELALGREREAPSARASPTPRVAVVRGTPDTPPTGETEADPADESAPADPAGLSAETAPLEVGEDALVPAPGPAEPARTIGTSDGPPPTPAVIGGGGGVRGGRGPGTGIWIVVGLGVLTLGLAAALLVARSRPTEPPTPPSSDPGPRIDLVFDVSGLTGERSVRFRRAPVLIGRGPDSDLVLDDPRVSRRHARVVVDGGTLWIEDLGSSSGTAVDGRTIDRAAVFTGATVRLGDTTLRIR